MHVYETASELYNDFLEIYLDEQNDLSDGKRKNMDPKYNPTNLMLDIFYYTYWLQKIEESANVSSISRLEGN